MVINEGTHSVCMVDTLLIGFDFDRYDELLRPYIGSFDDTKRLAADGESRAKGERLYVDFFGSRYQIMPNGTRGYAYLLHSDELEIMVARYRSANKDMYPLMIRFKADYLWASGMNAYQEVMDRMHRYFGSPIAEKVSRVDMACHLDGLEFGTTAIDAFVGRHRKDAVHRCDRKVQTMYVGSRSSQKVFLRVYNKSAMILEEGKKEWFFDVWNSAGMELDRVWNVEFQLSRAFLKELEVSSDGDRFETFDDFTMNYERIWQYLTTEWVRHVDLGTATRRERCQNSDFWDRVVNGFKDPKEDGYIRRDVQILRDSNALLPSMVGYMTSYCAKLGITSVDEMTGLFSYEVPRYLGQKGKQFDVAVGEKMAYYHGLAKLVAPEVEIRVSDDRRFRDRLHTVTLPPEDPKEEWRDCDSFAPFDRQYD